MKPWSSRRAAGLRRLALRPAPHRPRARRGPRTRLNAKLEGQAAVQAGPAAGPHARRRTRGPARRSTIVFDRQREGRPVGGERRCGRRAAPCRRASCRCQKGRPAYPDGRLGDGNAAAGWGTARRAAPGEAQESRAAERRDRAEADGAQERAAPTPEARGPEPAQPARGAWPAKKPPRRVQGPGGRGGPTCSRVRRRNRPRPSRR